MAEVLNAKTDQQKKMEIVKFVQQTRKSFIRLIALVKWANGVNKINKCSEILEFLDHQAWFFTGEFYKGLKLVGVFQGYPIFRANSNQT